MRLRLDTTHRRSAPALWLLPALLSVAHCDGTASDGIGRHAQNDTSATPPVAATVVHTDQNSTGTNLVSGAITTQAPELLVAFLASDSSGAGASFTSVTGCGLTWTRVARANARPGPAEIWSANATAPLAGCAVTAARGFGSWQGAITVVGYTNAAGVGASQTASAASGAPSISLTTRAAQSLVYAVGNDWDHATARTLASGQQMVAQTLTSNGDTYWVQSFGSAVANAGAVTLADTAPAGDEYNLAAVEILSAGATPPPDAGTDAGTDAGATDSGTRDSGADTGATDSGASDAGDAGACTPACAGRACGSDGCGGSCGACGSGQMCNASGQCVTSTGSAITSRPNDGTGFWPDSSNTGYQNAPDYPGHLTDFPVNQGSYTLLDGSYDGQTIRFRHFHGKVMIGTSGGSTPSGIAHINFYGCLFDSTLPEDIMVYDFATAQSTYTYSTFRPASVSAPPVSCAQSYQIAINQSLTQAMTVDHCEFWGFGNGVQFGDSSQARPLIFTNNYFHDAADPDNAGGCAYHHDGIGPCSDGGISYVTIDHNTLASRGNTNGVALQGTNPYDHITITNNYLSGWGYTVSIGAGTTAARDTNVTVTGNVFSGQLPVLYGPLYGAVPPGPGSVWSHNLYQVRSGDPWGQTAWNGEYWWPSDDVGHTTDY